MCGGKGRHAFMVACSAIEFYLGRSVVGAGKGFSKEKVATQVSIPGQ